MTPSSPPFLPLEEQSANGHDGVKNASSRLTKDQQPWRFKMSGKKLVSLLMFSVMAVVVCDALFTAPENRLIQPDFANVFLQWVQAHPTKGLVAIMLVIAVAVVFMIPIGTPLTLGCGYIYTGAYGWKLGLAIATIVAMGGSALGAVTCFLLGRYLMRDQVRTWIKKYPLFVAIDIGTYCDWGERKAREERRYQCRRRACAAVVAEIGIPIDVLCCVFALTHLRYLTAAAAEHGLRIMAMLYLTPILPLGPVSYMCGTTSMALSSFIIAKIAAFPLMFLYAFMGASTGALIGGKSGKDGVAIKEIEGNQTLIVSGIFMSVLMIAGITRYIKKELNTVSTKCLSDSD